MFDHGRDTKETFRTLTPEDLVNSAKEEIAIAKLLGEKVILMTCSTGSTVAALLAPEDPAVHSVLMYSPNIDVYDPTSKLLTGRWGKQMLGLVMGDYNQIDYDSTAAVYWNKEYHTNGLIALKYLIVFSKNTSKVTDRTIAFMDEVLGLIPIDAD